MPYWQLSAFYFFFFAALGAFLPYWALYLGELGLSAAEIGELMAVGMFTKVLAPNIWAWLADRGGRRMPIVRMASLLALCAFAAVYISRDFWWLAGVIFFFSFFWNATLPQVEATTFSHLGPEPQRYSRIRLWGSVGFIAAAAGLAPVLDRFGLTWVPAAMLVFMLGIWASTLSIPDLVDTSAPRPGASLAAVVRQPTVLALLLVCFLMQASHGPYYTFYSIFLDEHGYTRNFIGQLWALGVAAETVVFVFMHRLIAVVGLRPLLGLSLALAALRWVLIPLFVAYPGVLVLAQLLHAATFGVYHAAAIQLVHRHFSGPYQGRGQALYSSMSFGAGGALGSLLSGYAWDAGARQFVFFAAAAASLAALGVTLRWVHDRPRRV